MLNRINALRARLDALRDGRVLSAGLVDRTIATLMTPRVLPPLTTINGLSRALDRAGVRTIADARLLKTLGAEKGRAAAVATGLLQRASHALGEFEASLTAAERATLAESPLPGATPVLERALPELIRICRTAEIFRSQSPGAGEFTFESRRSAPTAPPASPLLAAAEFYAARARSNVADVVGKRRDLDRAHEVLLRIDEKLERERMLSLRQEVADARARIKELPSTRSLSQLLHEVRRSLPRDPTAAYRSLHGLYERAVEAGEDRLAEAASNALTELAHRDVTLKARIESDGEAPLATRGKAFEEGQEGALANLAFELTPELAEAFDLAAGCARFFDVEESLAEEVIEGTGSKRRPVPRRVPYPTQAMTFEPTGRLEDVNRLVISDPRRVVLDLASHQQLMRVYLEEEPPPVKKTVKRTAVRVYVLDASGSMYGPRARFRDAILIAELNNIRTKGVKGQPSEPLYYTYFNDTPMELTRIDSPHTAGRHIQRLFANSPAAGQTDITLALMSAFDSIRAAQGRDPHLARATVVLITDGEDKVDLELIRKIRRPSESVEIALSFIALGEENPDLRTLAQEQRAAGSRGFYHHLSDEEIAWARTTFDSPWRTLLPRDLDPQDVVLEQLEPHLEALELIARGEAPDAPVSSAGNFDALFPELPPPARDRVPEAVRQRVADVLEAVLAVAALAPLERRPEEAVTLLEHLRGQYGIELTAYLESLSDDAVAPSLAKVRLVCAPIQ